MPFGFRRLAGALAIAVFACSSAVRAEISEITIAQQYGTAFIPMMLMEEDKLIEKHAARQGLPAPKISWIRLSGPSMMNDGLISGTLHFAAAGSPSLAILWDRTRGGVKGLGMISNYKLYLNTRNPNVKSIADFGPNDRIAVSSVKVSMMAIRLQMEAEKLFGVGNHEKLDHLTVTLAHPDAMASLLNERSQITAHYAVSPFHERELADRNIRTVTTAGTAVFLLAPDKLAKDNPKTARAVFDALREAIDLATADPAKAIAVYKLRSNDKTPDEDLRKQTYNPDFSFALAPADVTEVTQFLHRIGTIKTPVRSWKDLFFDMAHDLPGN